MTKNRGKLLRDARKGLLEARLDWGFDDMYGEIKGDSEWKAVHVLTDRDYKDGFYNMHEFDFKSKSGGAYASKDGKTITLHVHSNHIVELRYKSTEDDPFGYGRKLKG